MRSQNVITWFVYSSPFSFWCSAKYASIQRRMQFVHRLAIWMCASSTCNFNANGKSATHSLYSTCKKTKRNVSIGNTNLPNFQAVFFHCQQRTVCAHSRAQDSDQAFHLSVPLKMYAIYVFFYFIQLHDSIFRQFFGRTVNHTPCATKNEIITRK